MSRFKFRAWDDYSKILMYRDFSIWCNGEVSDTEGNYLDSLMQFTGLKDVNGKDIYEGDIVKIPEGFYGDNAMSITKEHNEVVEHDTCDGDCAGSSFYLGLTDGVKWSDCEVIGNIYENPELLEN